MSLSRLALVCAALVAGAAAQPAAQPAASAPSSAWTAPTFCKGLECPKYTVVKKIADNIELRKYEPASWVSTTVKSSSMDAAMRGSFMKLFNYISGSNAAQSRIEMTAPVVTKVDPDGNYTISFYNPTKYQGPKAAAPPAPTDGSVFISHTPAMEMYVISYGGFPTAASNAAKAQELMAALKAANLPFDATSWFAAGYDSPMTLFNRRNEVMIPVAKPAMTAMTAMTKAATKEAPVAAKAAAPAAAKAAAPAAKPAAAKPAAAGRRML